MTGATLLTILGSLGFPTIVAALIAFFGTRRTLQANQPKTEAEADQVQAATAAQNLTAQSSVIATLVSENVRLSERVAVLEQKSRATEQIHEDLRKVYEVVRVQNELMRDHIQRSDAWIAHARQDGHTHDPAPRPFKFPDA